MSLDLFSAFIIGILGSGHCVGMCGGITTMLTSAIKPKADQNFTYQRASLILFYNIGRISSYAVIGAIVGFTGSIAAKNIGVPLGGLRLLAGVFLVFLGLYIGQWLMWISRIEYIGKYLWTKISPLTKKLLPIDSPFKALGLGLLWGWLPCGLVYSTLTWSLASGSTIEGAAIMASFGLGTLPALMTMSLSMNKLLFLINTRFFRKIIAVLLIGYGFYSINIAYKLLIQ
jgi:sulfite exporter TauE/SafE